MDNNERALLLRGKVRQATKDKLNPVSVKGEPYWDWEHKEILKFIEAGDTDKQIKDKIKKKRNYYSKQDVKKSQAKQAKKIAKIEDPAEKAVEKAKISRKSKDEAGEAIEKSRLEWMGKLEDIEYWNNPPPVAGMKKVVVFDPNKMIMTSVPANMGKQDKTGIASSHGGLRGYGRGDQKFGDAPVSMSAGERSHSAGRALPVSQMLKDEYHEPDTVHGLHAYKGYAYDSQKKSDRRLGDSMRQNVDEHSYGTALKFGYRHSSAGAPIHFPVQKPDPKDPETWMPETSQLKTRNYKVGVGTGILRNPESENKTVRYDKKIKIGNDLYRYLDRFPEKDGDLLDRDAVIDHIVSSNEGVNREGVAQALSTKWGSLDEKVMDGFILFGNEYMDENPEITVKDQDMPTANPFEWQEYELGEDGGDLEEEEWHRYSPLLPEVGGMPIFEYKYADQERVYRNRRNEYNWTLQEEDGIGRKPVRRIMNVLNELDSKSQQYQFALKEWKTWQTRWDIEEEGIFKHTKSAHSSHQHSGRDTFDVIHSGKPVYHLWADSKELTELSKQEDKWNDLSNPRSTTRYPEEIDEDPHHLFSLGDGDTTAPWKGMRLLNPFYIVIYTGLGLCYIKNETSLQYFGKLPYVATEFGHVNFKYAETMGPFDFVRDIDQAGMFGGTPELEEQEWSEDLHDYENATESGMGVDTERYTFANDILNLYSKYRIGEVGGKRIQVASGNGPWSIFPQFWGGEWKMWGDLESTQRSKEAGGLRHFEIGLNNIIKDADPYNTIHSGPIQQEKGKIWRKDYKNAEFSRIIQTIEQFIKLKTIYKQNATPEQILSGERSSELEKDISADGAKILKNWNLWNVHPLQRYKRMPMDWIGYRPFSFQDWEYGEKHIVPLLCVEGGFFRVGTIDDDYYLYPILMTLDDLSPMYQQREDYHKKVSLQEQYTVEKYAEYKDGDEGNRGIKRARLLFDKTDGKQIGTHQRPHTVAGAEEKEEDGDMEPYDRAEHWGNPLSKDWKEGAPETSGNVGGTNSAAQYRLSTIRGINWDDVDENGRWRKRAGSGAITTVDGNTIIEGKIYMSVVEQKLKVGREEGSYQSRYSSPETHLYRFKKIEGVLTGEAAAKEKHEAFIKKYHDDFIEVVGDVDLYKKPVWKIPKELVKQLSEQRSPLPFWTTYESMIEKPAGGQGDHPYDQWASIAKHWVLKDKQIKDLLPNQIAWIYEKRKQVADGKRIPTLEVVNEDTRLWINGGVAGHLSRQSDFNITRNKRYEEGMGVERNTGKPIMYDKGTYFRHKGYFDYLINQWEAHHDSMREQLFEETLVPWLNGTGGDDGAIRRTVHVPFPWVKPNMEFQVVVSGFVIPPNYKNCALGVWSHHHAEDYGPTVGMIKDLDVLDEVMSGRRKVLKISDIHWGHHMNLLGIHPLILTQYDEGDMERPILSDPYDRKEVIKYIEHDNYHVEGVQILTNEELNEEFGKHQKEPVPFKVGKIDDTHIWIKSKHTVGMKRYKKEQFIKFAENPVVGEEVNWRDQKTPYQLLATFYDERYSAGTHQLSNQSIPFNPVRMPYHFVGSGGDLGKAPYKMSATQHFTHYQAAAYAEHQEGE